MDWDTQIAPSIVFWGQTTWTVDANHTASNVPDPNVLLEYLKAWYVVSDTARAAIDGVINQYGQLRIGSSPNGGITIRSGPTPYILVDADLSAGRDDYYFTTDGRFVKNSIEISLLHEIVHLGLNLEDPERPANISDHAAYEALMNGADYNYTGGTVDTVNIALGEVGAASLARSSYEAFLPWYNPNLNSIQQNVSYTHGETISFARLGFQGSDDNMDISARDNPTETTLMLGLDGDDTIIGSSGRDFLYGGDGYDFIDGGPGNDFLFGEAGDSDIFGGAGNDVLVAMTGTNYLDGEDGNDTIWSRGAHTVIFGGNGDDTIIMTGGSVYTTVSGGAGADTFRVDTLGSGPTNIHISDSDASDQLIYNGYVLTGGPMTVIDYEQTTSGGNTTTSFEVAALDAHGNIYYRTASDPSNVVIELADGSTITIADFQNGDLGLSIPTITNHYDAQGNPIPGPYPYSNIANDGQNLDHASLSGRSVATSTYGPEHLPDHWYLV